MSKQRMNTHHGCPSVRYKSRKFATLEIFELSIFAPMLFTTGVYPIWLFKTGQGCRQSVCHANCTSKKCMWKKMTCFVTRHAIQAVAVEEKFTISRTWPRRCWFHEISHFSTNFMKSATSRIRRHIYIQYSYSYKRNFKLSTTPIKVPWPSKGIASTP